MPFAVLGAAIKACLFDLDGVVTRTAAIPARAWKRLFDSFGLVIGVDRGAGREALLAAGADVVVADLAELDAALAARRSG